MRTVLRVALTLLVVVLAIGAGYSLWHHYMVAPWTRDARIRADIVTIAPDVSGRVTSLKVRDNQLVAAGEVLLTVDRERYQAELEQIRAVAGGPNRCVCASMKHRAGCGRASRSAPSKRRMRRSPPPSPVASTRRRLPT